MQAEPGSTIHLHRTLTQIRELGKKAGVVLDPASPSELIEYVLHLCDIVLVMTVNPGFGGQAVLPEMLPQVRRLRAICAERGLSPVIEVDGGENVTTAAQAAGVIHTDFEKGFIRAEVIAYTDYIACNGEQGAKEAGKMRLEGRDYLVRDGDVMHFRFNV